ncbi:Glutathione Peroxidase 6 [Manis pentadactyla]|nr:Glutathione Peroxidase 6 [Manis pentadactyla]
MIWQLWASCLFLLFLVDFAQLTQMLQKMKMDCYKGVTGTIYEYGALTLNAQYPELNALQEELKPFGVVVLGFPCNQFGKQEPGKNSEILYGLKYVRPGSGFVPKFQLFEKGDDRDALKAWGPCVGLSWDSLESHAKNCCPPTSDLLGSSNQLFWEPMKVHDIRWNFEKFLVGPDGVPVIRWFHQASVSTVKSDILEYLKQFKTE